MASSYHSEAELSHSYPFCTTQAPPRITRTNQCSGSVWAAGQAELGTRPYHVLGMRLWTSYTPIVPYFLHQPNTLQIPMIKHHIGSWICKFWNKKVQADDITWETASVYTIITLDEITKKRYYRKGPQTKYRGLDTQEKLQRGLKTMASEVSH